MPNELTIIQVIVQSGGIGIALYLIWTNSREREQINQERKEEREKWYETVSNHMKHDMELHERGIAESIENRAQSERSNALIKKLCRAVDGIIKKVNNK